MNKIKILHIIKSLGRGGAEVLLQETLLKHDQERFEFHYIYFLPWKDHMVAGIKAAGGIVTNFSAKDNIRIIIKVKDVIKYIKKHKINIIHCHLPWAGFLGRLVHFKTGIPTIYTEHNKQERYHKITRFFNKITFNSQSFVIAVSGDVEISIRKNINVKIPVRVILNGVNTEQFMRSITLRQECRKLWGIPENAIIFGNIAVFRIQKRLKEWVDLFTYVYSRCPNIFGVIVGGGLLNHEINEYIKLKGMTNRILLPGVHTNVIPWLSAMDVFVMTSEFEGLPIALLEAMSMECAIVSTDAGGIKEVINNGQDGFLHSVSEWKDMEEDMVYLANNRDEIMHWGKVARQRVVKDFGIQSMVEQTEALYLSILNKS